MDTKDEERGLYDKFYVSRTDGQSAPGKKHAECDYFVLDLVHDPFARVAVFAYATACQMRFPRLAKDLISRVNRGA